MIGNKFLSVAGAPEPTDAQFNYVTMLLHGDGTNGAQNNTFTDSSTNNFTITRNGNTTQGSFSPYGSLWSTHFDGSSYLDSPANSSFAFTGDFCMEGWIYQTQNTSGNAVFELGTYTNGILFRLGPSPSFDNLYINGTSVVAPAQYFPINQWNHYAITRQGTTARLFANGTQVWSGTQSGTINSTNGKVRYGEIQHSSSQLFYGYMTDCRVVNGSAVYTSAFTPPTTTLTAITNTVYLICQSNRFVDNSSNAYTVTPTNTPKIQRFNPFGTSTAYSTATIGGSGYFDGSGDYLTGPTTNSAFDFGSGDWTVETWAFPTAFSSQMAVFISLDNATSSAYAIGLLINTNGSVRVYQYGGSYFINSTSTTGVVSLNSWSHIVAVRSGSTFAIFVNGTRVASVTGVSGTQAANKTVNIGQDPYASNLRYTGYLSDLRVVKGTAVYDPTQTTITIPNTPLSAVTNTQLLLSNTNGAIYDNAMMNDLETVGNAQISTSVVKYGTGSMYFDGTGDYLGSNAASTDLYAFGTGNFTIEFWIYLNTTSGTQIVYDCRPTGTNGTQPIVFVDSGVLKFQHSSTVRITGSSLSTGIWYHVAVARSGTDTKMFVNGTQSGSTYSSDTTSYTNSAGRPIIGIDAANTSINPLNGYIDDLRITKGYARYTTTFTPPTAALPDKGT